MFEISHDDYEKVLLDIAKHNPSVIVKAYNRLYPPKTPSIADEIKAMAAAGQSKIECIKRYRQATQCDLITAKISVENIAFPR